jgi:hypothetical protein
MKRDMDVIRLLLLQLEGDKKEHCNATQDWPYQTCTRVEVRS